MRPIEPMTLPDVVRAEPTMPRPRFIEALPGDLLVDETYQRGLTVRSIELIRKMVAHWDWRGFKPPVVVDVGGGKFHVIDGQHTAIAAASNPNIGTIPVQLVDAPDIADRAAAFVRHNRDRISVTPLQLHHSMVAAGDDDAVTIAQVCGRADVLLLKSQPAQWAEGSTIAIASLKGLVRRRYPIGARRVLDVCRKARLAPISAAHIKAVEFLLFEHEDRALLDDEDLVNTLRAIGNDDRVAKMRAAELNIPLWRGLAVDLYRNTRKKRRGPGNGTQAA